MIRVTFTLTAQLLKALRQHSEATGLTLSDIVRRALEQYLEE